MLKRLFVILSLTLIPVASGMAQNSNTSTPAASPGRQRTVVAKPTTTPKAVAKATPQQTPAARPPVTRPSATPSSVVGAFNALLEGIRHADPAAAVNAYWNSPRLVLFNFNGTVTKGWDQLKQNREASYPEMKDVKLDVKDLRVTMLGRDGALITCQWTQSLIFRGTPETNTGRMTIVFRKIGKEWKAIHLHTSNDRPDASRIPASEQTPVPRVTP
ncbi:MAG: SnoaL-like domain [Blastocatellia bacterium]|jgi:ketosteroid isomerase-like protein|nr:SnoaL-like domain [Blastocatellia bacterium]